MTSMPTARIGAQSSTFVGGTEKSDVPMVEVTFPIRAVTLDQIDAFCQACNKPGEMTRDLALRLMVETGSQFWKASSDVNRTDEARSPLCTARRDHLDQASIPEILLYGLILPEDGDPVLGVLQGVRRELGVLTALAECVDASSAAVIVELDAILDSVRRRVELGIELYARARRASASAEPFEATHRAEAEPLKAPDASPSEQEGASAPCPGGQGS